MNETPDEMIEMIDNFGPSFGFWIIQVVIFAVWLILAIIAIRRAATNTTGAAIPLWVLVVLLFPIVGSIITIVCTPKKRQA